MFYKIYKFYKNRFFRIFRFSRFSRFSIFGGPNTIQIQRSGDDDRKNGKQRNQIKLYIYTIIKNHRYALHLFLKKIKLHRYLLYCFAKFVSLNFPLELGSHPGPISSLYTIGPIATNFRTSLYQTKLLGRSKRESSTSSSVSKKRFS